MPQTERAAWAGHVSLQQAGALAESTPADHGQSWPSGRAGRVLLVTSRSSVKQLLPQQGGVQGLLWGHKILRIGAAACVAMPSFLGLEFISPGYRVTSSQSNQGSVVLSVRVTGVQSVEEIYNF